MVTFGTARAIGQAIVFTIALAVGAIPEGLPASVTIVLAIGVQRMARRRAIIPRVPAVESLNAPRLSVRTSRELSRGAK